MIKSNHQSDEEKKYEEPSTIQSDEEKEEINDKTQDEVDSDMMSMFASVWVKVEVDEVPSDANEKK